MEEELREYYYQLSADTLVNIIIVQQKYIHALTADLDDAQRALMESEQAFMEQG